ncbi:hypothetical protein H5S40_07965 [Limosilactobacillus sp. RRLNB_1_1]|uniref:TOTE conflict systems S1/CSD-like domain-containing protein n=1 Tax=Limosilactobacillus albertensis TaxID=2759752 RepID=A0A7W3TSG1_9LACO|nr:hypothetical protein [Limosilactobacillus albertensis]MBB1070085.1 hypothetical protein [Limosilactobacillus albertensis]MCD7117322.1 hypothetical protein [Limosilactobacillus albertensis]MCD7128926.1 hypothetical protein [Limosilactobacillus albertensis]
MNEENTQEKISKIKELRDNYKESNDINELNQAYKECQEADNQGIDVSWQFPWVMYDYLKRLADENIRSYLYTLDVIKNKGFFTNGSIPLTVQKNFIIAVQNNICWVAWKLKEKQDYPNLFALYERGFKYFADFDEHLIENTELFHRNKSKYYGKQGFFEAIINTLVTSEDIPKKQADLDVLISRLQQVDEYFNKKHVPYYYFLVTKITRTISGLTWNYYKSQNEELLNSSVKAYLRLGLNFPEDTKIVNIILPLIQKYHGKDDKYCDNYPGNFTKVIDLLDLGNFSTEDYEKYQSEDGKKYPGLAERTVTSYLKAQSKSYFHTSQQVKEISAKVIPILERHSDYTWAIYFYCQILLQGGFYDNARKIGLQLVKNNIANPNMWGLLATACQGNFTIKMACLYQACTRGTMSQNVRKNFIDGLIAMKDPNYYPIAKREILQLRNKEQVQQYKSFEWFNDTKEASKNDIIPRLDAIVSKLLYPDAEPCRFYVDWQNEHNYWVVIPNAKSKLFVRRKIRKKLVDKKLKTNQGYSAVLISYDDDSTKVKYVGAVSEVRDDEFTKLYIKEDCGVFSAVRDFGFIVKDNQALDEDYFCNSKIVKEKNLRNYDTIKFLAKYSFDKKNEKWKWGYYKILAVNHANPAEFKRTFQGTATIKKNRTGHAFAFVDDGDDSCYVSGDLLTKAGIEFNGDSSTTDFNSHDQLSLKLLAEKKYNDRRKKWEWRASSIQEVNKGVK